MNFNYVRSTRKDGIQGLIISLIVILALSCIPFVMTQIKEDIFFLIFWYVIILLVGTISLIYNIKNIIIDDEFIFKITDDELICKNPSGKSYTIKIKDIDSLKVTENHSDGGSDSWSIVTNEGQYNILYNYNNPVEKIIDLLKTELDNVKVIKN